MRRNPKKFIITILACLIIFIFLSWRYPYAPISIKNSVGYNADNIVVDQYQKKLERFKEVYDLTLPSAENDPTINRIQFILPMFEQPWLLKKGDTDISKDELDRMLFEVKEARKVILLLPFEENYSMSTKSYLKMLVDQTLSLEEEIHELQHSTNHSRKTLDRQLRNLHVSFISNFQLLVTFYEVYMEEKKKA
jgi:hypothetical protein